MSLSKKPRHKPSLDKLEDAAAEDGYYDPELWLKHQYRDGVSISRIAFKCGVSDTTIFNFLRMFGIKRRKQGSGDCEWRKSCKGSKRKGSSTR